MNPKKLGLLALIVLLVGAFFFFDLGRFFTLESIKARQSEIQSLFAARPFYVAAVFFGVYVLMAALALPGAALLTLLAGAIFGLLWGTLIVSFASSIGATLAFFGSRFIAGNYVQSKFGDRLAAINRGIDKDGAFYLFTLRLVPVFPFFAVNLLMGLTRIKTKTFYWASQIGMLAGTLVYVNVGTQLGQLTSLKGILSPTLIASFLLLAVLPLIAKKAIDILQARKVYARWTRPAHYEQNMVVIGAGSGGLVSALIAAAVKAKVTLIERHKMGGDCLNTGCVPSKALIKTAKLLNQASHSQAYGIKSMKVEFDFAEIMERVQRVIKTIEPHDSPERFTGLGVECVAGSAKIKSPWEVEVSLTDHAGKVTGTRTITTRNIVIATGARPLVPPIPGIQDVAPLTSDNLWEIRELPKRLLVLGGGPIGAELTQAFARFGSKVTQVEMAPRIMVREDPEVSEMVMQALRRDGIDVRVNHKALRFEVTNGQKVLIAEAAGAEVRIEFDVMICALGRAANVTGFGLEELQIPLTKTRTVEVNDYLQTNYPNIYAVGDVAGPYQFTHTAAHMAWSAAVNALFGRFKKFRIDHDAGQSQGSVVRLAQGSWGANGDFSMWSNDQTAWTWKRLWPLEDAFWSVARAALAGDERRRLVLAQAARSLLLAQSSDWQFIISTGAATDYAERRFVEHCDDAELLVAALRPGAAAGVLDDALRRVPALRARDDLFPDVLDAIAEALG